VAQARLLCSDELFRILGVPKSNLTGEYAFVLPLVHEDDRQRVVGFLDAALNQGMGYETDYRIVRPAGDVQVVHEKVEVKCRQGSATHIVGTLQLVTELKKIERELRQAKAESDSSLRRSQQQLEAARNQLIQSEKMAAIGQLAAGVAHEINTPIGYINSNFHTLQYYVTLLEQLFAAYAEVRDRLPDGLPEKERIVAVERDIDLPFLRDDLPKLVFESREGGERVKKIVMDLKNFARQEEVHWEQARVNDLCEHSLNIVFNEIKYKAELVREYGETPPIRCLPVQLEQVLVNLLVNAAQAIEGRGVITLRTGTADGEVFIEVEDTGQGIAPEHLVRLFEPFFTTKPPGSGTGLGLSISYTIVQRHGGEIRVRSTPGKGSVFRVVLPIQPELQATPS
jgi:PAS domain S-box-containing protein